MNLLKLAGLFKLTKKMNKTALAIFSHPDDAEFLCTGTLSLLKKQNWDIHIATHAPGDKGTAEYNREEISKIRIAEAEKAVSLLGAEYHCLGSEDLFILYNKEIIHETVSLIRKLKPTIVFTASPSDYMVDHEMTSKIVQTSCFAAGIKNLEIEETPFEPVPYLYYCDSMDSRDKFGHRIIPSIYVDISSEIKLKEQMLACHESQRNWLMTHHKMDEYLESMKRVGEIRGREVSRAYAEGFRQHLGHGFPNLEILSEILGSNVIITQKELYNDLS